VQIPLSATRSRPACSAPNPLDFGTVKTGCSSQDRTVTVHNVCPASQTVQSITSTAPEFAITQVSPMPKVLASGASTRFSVKYTPTSLGSDLGAVTVQTSQLPQTYVVPVSGTAGSSGVQTDTLHVPKKADVLFVVDNSGSMYDKQLALSQAFGSFIQFATTQKVDFRIAVTTTGVDVAHGGESSNGDDLNGCFYAAPGNPKILTPQTPDLAHVFGENVQVGTNGNWAEMLIRPAYLALSQPALTGCNAGFLRDDATLSIVTISDAVDQDLVPVSVYLGFLLSLKAPNLVTFSAMIPPDPIPSGCYMDGTDPNGRVEEMIDSLAGVNGDICLSDWSTSMERIGKVAFGYRTRFFLTSTPDLAQGPIAVAVDGVDYPATSPTGEQRWEYDAVVNAIDFDVQTVPDPGVAVTASYPVSCH
jgi:hypothetical protein